MRGNEFLEKMELVDPEFIEAADQMPKKNTKKWAVWGTLAACACMAVAVFAFWNPSSGNAHNTELTKTTYEALAELGFQRNLPAGAKETSVGAFEAGAVTGLEIVFEMDGLKWIYRVAAAEEVVLTDISGLDEVYEKAGEAKVSWCPAKLYFTEGAGGKILWMDVVPGLVYSLSTEEGALEELLIRTANEIFIPAQGDVQGEDTVSEAVIVMDTYEDIIESYGNIPEAVGYAYMDMDLDGEDELIIGAQDRVLLEMYTLVEGVPELVFASDENHRYYLCKALDDASALLFEQEIFSEGELCEWKSYSWYNGKMHVTQALRLEKTEWMMGYETDGEIEYNLPVTEDLVKDIMAASEASRVIPEYVSF